jgi:hypothetical protein
MSATNKTNGAEQTFTDRCKETCKAWRAEIEQAREMIVNEFHETLEVHGSLFRLALNEAEALAGQTEYPHLFYPALAQERVQAVAAWRQRQGMIQQRPLLVAA